MKLQQPQQAQSLFIRDKKSGRGMRTKRFPLTALLSLLVLLALPCAAFAQSALTDDADTQNGTTSNLTLDSSSKVYLKFKLSSTLPANTPGSDVARATIKLYLGVSWENFLWRRFYRGVVPTGPGFTVSRGEIYVRSATNVSMP